MICRLWQGKGRCGRQQQANLRWIPGRTLTWRRWRRFWRAVGGDGEERLTWRNSQAPPRWAVPARTDAGLYLASERCTLFRDTSFRQPWRARRDCLVEERALNASPSRRLRGGGEALCRRGCGFAQGHMTRGAARTLGHITTAPVNSATPMPVAWSSSGRTEDATAADMKHARGLRADFPRCGTPKLTRPPSFRTEACTFSGFRIYPGHGMTYVRVDGKVGTASKD